ncbi:hypothetical protein XGA_1288, partial [Xanthomonas hortorum ATCC 19865]
RPPVLLEYDEDTNLKTVYLENTSRQFDRTHTEGTLAYVDRVDAPLDASQQGPRPRVRQPIMLTQTARKTEAGRYMLELYAKRRPTRAFWVEAVSSERKVVLAQQWVVPDAAGRIRMPVGLEHAVGKSAPGWITPKTSAWTMWHWSRMRRCTGIRRAPLLLGAAAQRWFLGAACTTRTCRF